MGPIAMDVESVAVRVDEILAEYNNSSSYAEAHVMEDSLLAAIVRAGAKGLDVKTLCQEAERLLDTKRKKWFE